MKRLIYNELARYDFPEDLETLQNQLFDAGYKVRKSDISHAWEHFSGSRCAQWLCLSKSAKQNVEDILNFLEVEE